MVALGDTAVLRTRTAQATAAIEDGGVREEYGYGVVVAWDLHGVELRPAACRGVP